MSIRQRGPNAFQVRVSPFEAQTVPTRRAAERLELDLKLRRSLGDLYEEPSISLGEATDGALERIEATRSPRAKTREFNRRCAKFWESLRNSPVANLRRAKIEDMIYARAREHPRSAKNELEFLKRVLHDAKGRGQRVRRGDLRDSANQAPASNGASVDSRRVVRTRVVVPRARVSADPARRAGRLSPERLVQPDG